MEARFHPEVCAGSPLRPERRGRAQNVCEALTAVAQRVGHCRADCEAVGSIPRQGTRRAAGRVTVRGNLVMFPSHSCFPLSPSLLLSLNIR